MIDSIHNVDENFYRLLKGGDASASVLTIPTHRGDMFDISVIYYKKSAVDYTEAVQEAYPRLSVMNTVPEVKADYFNPFDRRFGGVNLVAGTVAEFKRPIPYEFKYMVHSACQSESQSDAIKQFFFNNFGHRGQNTFLFNPIEVPGTDPVGDYVEYGFTYSDVERSDGTYETAFEFTLLAWVNLHEGAESPIADINIDLWQRKN